MTCEIGACFNELELKVHFGEVLSSLFDKTNSGLCLCFQEKKAECPKSI